MDETAFNAALRSLARHPAARGLADDCAVLEVGGETLILTHDAMAEGVHWLPSQDMADVAWKLVAVNLSDLAAKGAEPLGVLLGYALGDADGRFLDGLHEALTAFEVPLLGGDTIRSEGPRTIGLTAIGRATHTPVPPRAPAHRPVTRFTSPARWAPRCSGSRSFARGAKRTALPTAALPRASPKAALSPRLQAP